MKYSLPRTGIFMCAMLFCAVLSGTLLSGRRKRCARQREKACGSKERVHHHLGWRFKIHYLEAGKSVASPSAEVGNPLPVWDRTHKRKRHCSLIAAQIPFYPVCPRLDDACLDLGKTKSHISRATIGWWRWTHARRAKSSQVSEWALSCRARLGDIKAVVDQLHLAPVVIVSWSMAVVETMAYVDQFWNGRLRRNCSGGQ